MVVSYPLTNGHRVVMQVVVVIHEPEQCLLQHEHLFTFCCGTDARVHTGDQAGHLCKHYHLYVHQQVILDNRIDDDNLIYSQ